jgi:hypothetical protein
MSQTWFDRVLEWLKNGGFRGIGYFIAIGTVAGVAARVSYSHIRDITWIAGQSADVAALLPLAVDGMLLACTLAMSQDKARNLMPRPWARFGFWFGATISVLCNAADTLVRAAQVIARFRTVVTATIINDPSALSIAMFVAILAPMILLITAEVMSRRGKPRKGEPEVSVTPKVATTSQPEAAETVKETVNTIADTLPVPVSPAPMRAPRPPALVSVKSTSRSGPQVSGPVRSPLDPNRILWDGPPQV